MDEDTSEGPSRATLMILCEGGVPADIRFTIEPGADASPELLEGLRAMIFGLVYTLKNETEIVLDRGNAALFGMDMSQGEPKQQSEGFLQ